MTPQRILGAAAALLGLYLLFQQVSGTVAYLNRGASVADAVTPDVGLIAGAALLVCLAGALLAMGRGLGRWIGMAAILLNGLVVFLTLALGPDRPVWIVGALAELVLIAAITLAFIRPKSA